MNYHRSIGSIAWLSIRSAANLIVGRTGSANSSNGCVLVYLDAGELFVVKVGTRAAQWAENNAAIEIIGYYNRKTTVADVAEDLADAQARALGAARRAA